MIGWLLFFLFIALPALELYLLIQIGQAIGLWYTLAIIVGTGFLGAVLAKRQGTRALRDVQAAMSQGRLPGTELVAGALFLVGAAFLLTPGVVTDAIGLLWMMPPVRRLSARGVVRLARGRVTVVRWGARDAAGEGHRGAGTPPGTGPGAHSDVIDVDAEE